MKVISLPEIASRIRCRRSGKTLLSEFINQCKIEDAIPIPEGATNGDMIKAMFPNGKEYDNDGDVRYEIEIDFDYSFCSYFDGVWWNAPYKGECNLSEKPTGSESEGWE